MYITMNMCILITMNIYISPVNEKYLREQQENTMSGLVNELLTHHRKQAKLLIASTAVPVTKLQSPTVKPNAASNPLTLKEQSITYKNTNNWGA
jgi:hypothetical protein